MGDLRIELTHQLRMPYSNDYLNKGTKLIVEDVRGAWYVCRTDKDEIVCVHKQDCREVKENA